MKYAPNEAVRMEAESGKLVLTNYRVFVNDPKSDAVAYLSITLDAVASCSLAVKGKTNLLYAAGGVLVLLGLFVTDGFFVGLVLAMILGAYWHMSKVATITIASIGGERILAEVQGLAHKQALDFLRAVENEKLRFLGKIGQD